MSFDKLKLLFQWIDVCRKSWTACCLAPTPLQVCVVPPKQAGFLNRRQILQQDGSIAWTPERRRGGAVVKYRELRRETAKICINPQFRLTPGTARQK